MEELNVAIVALGWSHQGGISVYIWNLAQHLAKFNVEYKIIPVATMCKSWRDRFPIGDENYLLDADLVFLVHFYPIFRNLDFQRDMIAKIRYTKKPTVVLLCDTLEWGWSGAIDVLRYLNPVKIFFLGEQNRHLFNRVNHRWFSRARSEVHRLPYNRYCTEEELASFKKNGRAICTARIDFHKRIEWIYRAGGIEIWSAIHPDSLYDHARFDGKLREYPLYKNGFGFSKSEYDRVYGTAGVLVDMTELPGDGGRPQYTFLEAMDYGLGIIGASDWEVDEARSEFLPGKHYYSAGSPEEIRKGLQFFRENGNIFRAEHKKLLALHEAESVTREIVSSWRQLTK